jgi:hypothetical protein
LRIESNLITGESGTVIIDLGSEGGLHAGSQRIDKRNL